MLFFLSVSFVCGGVGEEIKKICECLAVNGQPLLIIFRPVDNIQWIIGSGLFTLALYFVKVKQDHGDNNFLLHV